MWVWVWTGREVCSACALASGGVFTRFSVEFDRPGVRAGRWVLDDGPFSGTSVAGGAVPSRALLSRAPLSCVVHNRGTSGYARSDHMIPVRKGKPADFAMIALSLVALIEAGVGPQLAWQALSRKYPQDPIVSRVVLGPASRAISERIMGAVQMTHGEVLPYARGGMSAADRQGWTEIAALWRVAEVCGAPVGRVLAESALLAVDRVEQLRQVERSIASAQLTGRVLSLLPVAGLGLVAILGFDVFSAFARSPIAAMCIGLAGLLSIWSHAWRARMVVQATRGSDEGALFVRLVAVAVEAGVAVRVAIECAREALARTHSGKLAETAAKSRGDGTQETLGMAARVASSSDSTRKSASASTLIDIGMGVRVVAEVTALSADVGAPIGSLLIAESDRLRRAGHSIALARAVALEGRQLTPLAVCDLPAFLLAGIVPAVISLWGGW